MKKRTLRYAFMIAAIIGFAGIIALAFPTCPAAAQAERGGRRRRRRQATQGLRVPRPDHALARRRDADDRADGE